MWSRQPVAVEGTVVGHNDGMATIRESEVVAGVYVVDPDVHGDERGLFVETYRREWFPHGREMVQANRGDRRAGAVVGLHYHVHQSDYWYVPRGRARVVLHDLRAASPTDGATLTLDLGPAPGDGPAAGLEEHRGVLIPPGVAHGFAAVSDMTITYLVDHYYDPADELGVAWDDPAIGADWGVAAPVLSGRDRSNPRRADIDPKP
ncbi:MAG TPA: dTDP-4-dehydrorhamnose 3,5-epimerase [Acidimicrobiales bacterium]|nr:dTDP-4-dehydrorhamnose 3,5-epimerase [Acidimicrobiales bacterium]